MTAYFNHVRFAKRTSKKYNRDNVTFFIDVLGLNSYERLISPPPPFSEKGH